MPLYSSVHVANKLNEGQIPSEEEISEYRKISNIRRTKSTTLNGSRLVLLWYFPNPMKPDVKSRMKM